MPSGAGAGKFGRRRRAVQVKRTDSEIEDRMTGISIPVEEAAKEWLKDPEFRAAYDSLEDEFALAAALIKARSGTNMTRL